MMHFGRIVRGAIAWPMRHATISILTACLSIAFAVAYVSRLGRMKILYYQGDQLSEQDLYGVWKIEKSSAEFLKKTFTDDYNGEYIETNQWIYLMPGNWCVHNCYVDYFQPHSGFSRTDGRCFRQKRLFAEPVGTAEREHVAESLTANTRGLPGAKKSPGRWRNGEEENVASSIFSKGGQSGKTIRKRYHMD